MSNTLSDPEIFFEIILNSKGIITQIKNLCLMCHKSGKHSYIWLLVNGLDCIQTTFNLKPNLLALKFPCIRRLIQ